MLPMPLDQRGIIEGAVAIVVVERIALIGEVGNHQVRPSVVVVIGKVHAHAGKGLALGVDRRLGLQAYFLETFHRLFW